LYDNQPRQLKQRRRGRKWLVGIVVIIVVLVGLDFGAKAFAESKIASQLASHGFPAKPGVSIAGFPFLTQVAARDIHQITISSSNINAGPVTITSMNVVADSVKVNSGFSGGTTGPVHGTVLISLGALGNALSVAGPLAGFLGGGGGLKVTSVGSSKVKGSLNLAGGILSWSATWRVVAAGPSEIQLHLVSSSGLPSALAGPARNIKLPLKSLPLGLQMTGGLNSSSSGINVNVKADSLSFGG
jgi:LmeA-like phospholipid-binding